MAPSVFQRLSRLVRSNRADTNSSTNSPNNRQTTQYVFNREESEADRLTQQYNFTKRILHRTTALPTSILRNTVSSVIDVGAGTLIWTLDLLHTTQPRPKRIYASDISTAHFPPREEIESLGITTLQHDATERFPKELHSQFDIVNMRFLIFALSEEGWIKALRNVRELLKPGGRIILFELNSRFFHPKSVGLEHWKYDPNESFDKNLWWDRCNAVTQRSCIELNNFIPDLVSRLPSLLNSTGYRVESCAPLVTPIAVLARTRKGPNGINLTREDADSSGKNFMYVFNALTTMALRRGALQSLNGPVETEEGRMELMKDFERGLWRDGAWIVYVEVIARRDG